MLTRSRPILLLLSVAQIGCAATHSDALCRLSASELEVLKPRVLAFLVEQKQTSDVTCERLYDTTASILGHGCAIAGGPANTGSCPGVLDGDYVVVFDRSTLQPKERLFVAD